MFNSFIHFARKIHPARIPLLVRFLMKDEAISGKLIILATIAALIAANSFLNIWYQDFLHTQISIGIGSWKLSMDLQHWVNEGLMAIFFLVVGLELKRELFRGDFRHLQTAVLPTAAAIGGMIVPALIYLAFTFGSDAAKGWAIPMATDIAIAIGILALLGDRIPSSIRLFLLTLAIVDDIGAVIIIALFYSSTIHIQPLLVAASISILLLLAHNSRFLKMPVFIIMGIFLWLAVQASGIHASIAGALLGLLAPISIPKDQQETEWEPIAERLERAIIPLSTLIVIPFFAFTNTGVALSLSGFDNPVSVQIALGIILGLVLGKLVGIAGMTWLMYKLRLARLPDGANWNHVVGIGLLAGIGFTVSIFVTELSFVREEYIVAAKLSIFAASTIAALLGLYVLRFMSKSKI